MVYETTNGIVHTNFIINFLMNNKNVKVWYFDIECTGDLEYRWIN
jgi:hypothetical protein